MHTSTIPLPTPVATPSTTCEHAWRTASRHNTSEGVIRYVRCVRCSAHRVDTEPAAVPTALSRVVGETPERAAEPV